MGFFMTRKTLTTDIRYLKGIGEKRRAVFHGLGIETIDDLVYYFPRRYEDRTHSTSIAKLKAGECQIIKGKVLGFGQRRSFRRRSFSIFEAIIDDGSGRLECVWFNQPYLKQYFKRGEEVVLYGKVEPHGTSLQMQNPEYEITAEKPPQESLNYGRIVPVYSSAEKLSQRMFRRIIKTCMDEYVPSLVDVVPYDIRERHHLLNIASSIVNMHFPHDAATQALAYKRILFEEGFLLQLLFGLKRLKKNRMIGIKHSLCLESLNSFEKSLSFTLTSSQRSVIEEIKQDMVSGRQMQRLLQGDVGSGKTIVAVYACLIAVSSGFQAAFMVPTELLAQQHFGVISQQLSAFSLKGRTLTPALLTSSLRKKEKEKIYAEVEKGGIDILIGTHAIIQENLIFKKLGLAVIDEQHKFGVHQRLSLLAKGINPDCLIMTATPIPRTLAMTIYSDLDISTMRELPAGRKPVETYCVDESKRQWVYDFIRDHLSAGRQAYIVYPLIDEPENMEVKAASVMYEGLKDVFHDFSVGLIHGRLKQSLRDSIMESFKNAQIDILVSTVVIEVGIDIPNAAVMVIEQAERFGLSQLHQLRGRIGRGSFSSFCILISATQDSESLKRLQVMVEESDGFVIAERDLALRGPGEFFGVRQHGIPEMRLNPLENLELLNTAKEEASRLLEKDALLSSRQNAALAEALKTRFPEYERLMEAG